MFVRIANYVRALSTFCFKKEKGPKLPYRAGLGHIRKGGLTLWAS